MPHEIACRQAPGPPRPLKDRSCPRRSGGFVDARHRERRRPSKSKTGIDTICRSTCGPGAFLHRAGRCRDASLAAHCAEREHGRQSRSAGAMRLPFSAGTFGFWQMLDDLELPTGFGSGGRRWIALDHVSQQRAGVCAEAQLDERGRKLKRCLRHLWRRGEGVEESLECCRGAREPLFLKE